MRRFATLALVALALSPAACTVDRDVQLFIEGGSPDLVYELRVYESSTCATVSDRINWQSATTDGSVHSQTFRQGEGRAVGALSPTPHCFVVIARDGSCAPVAFAAQLVDLASSDAVTVRLSPVSGAGGCGASRMCVGGACVDAPPLADGGPDAFVPCSTDGMLCSGDPASTCCGGRCIATISDPANCGGCGRGCGDATGEGGACCAGACVDLTSDEANCGACGAPCAAMCNGGLCGVGTDILVQVDPRGSMASEIAVEVTWFQWDGRDPDPIEVSGYSTAVTLADGAPIVRISPSAIRPPEEPLLLCNRDCQDEAMCPCLDPSSGRSGRAGFGWIVARAPERMDLLGRAPVVVVYVASEKVFDDTFAGLVGFTFSEPPRFGISVYQPGTDGLLVPVAMDTPIRLPVCDLPTEECTAEPVARPYP